MEKRRLKIWELILYVELRMHKRRKKRLELQRNGKGTRVQQNALTSQATGRGTKHSV